MYFGRCIFSCPSLYCKSSASPVHYAEAMAELMSQVNLVATKKSPDLLWFLQHHDVYTSGASADCSDVLDITAVPVKTDRGGKYTYHGPGQLIIYPVLDLNSIYDNKPDIRKFVADMSSWIVRSLNSLDITCFSDGDNIGIWSYDKEGHKKKIASLGFKIKKWVSYHGIALNVSTDLSKFQAIKPCGLSAETMSSLQDLGYSITINQITECLLQNFLMMFNIS